jgi:hypothetical protein
MTPEQFAQIIDQLNRIQFQIAVAAMTLAGIVAWFGGSRR